jgi:hypothetical protein
LHLTPAGYRAAYAAIAAAIKDNFPSLTVDPEGGPNDFPDFKTIRAAAIAEDVRAFVAKRSKVPDLPRAGGAAGALPPPGSLAMQALPEGTVLAAVTTLPPSN